MWRGIFALKRVTDVPLDRLRRNLAVLPALAEAGIPVIVPVVGSSGGIVVEVDGSGYCLFPWARGAHVRGVDLPHVQVRRLGVVLAKLHLALGHAAETGGLTADVVTPERTSEKADQLAATARTHGTGDAFDGAALDALRQASGAARRVRGPAP
ncbi:phosphotransferase [Streptomyces termitum]|uniref:Aminoglycoside phosphotransferase domain-containing protein n=1 Tax=Streptomyces termitum TaxID=67368 RepID=A0A918T805_9ACTN|nr:phosphotransferase [Streptomyces termitum]GHB10500.1 hypothetical protein GCM10010305_61690 [Streptomyces termitum]